jgi:hypothetical protein
MLWLFPFGERTAVLEEGRSMRTPPGCLLVALVCFLRLNSGTASVLYVNPGNPVPAAPYNSWSAAATNIQDAVDAATSGDTILVTNGTYNFGARVGPDGSTNRVWVGAAVTLQSVNGSASTLIDGGKLMRCLYLTNGASLSGFTLTNGNSANGGALFCASTNAQVVNSSVLNSTAHAGGGVYSGTLSNCVIQGNTCPFTGANGGGAYGAVLINCTVSGNTTGGDYPNATGATSGGGASAGTLTNCTITGNAALGAGGSGGGAGSCTLNNCLLQNNYADFNGGGAAGSLLNDCQVLANGSGDYGGGAGYGCTLNRCTVSRNGTPLSGPYGYARPYGGGARSSTLNNCLLTANVGTDGGGAFDCTLNNCVISSNTAARYGGGMAGGVANNCTVCSNALLSAGFYGGGVYQATLNNSIIFFNSIISLNGVGTNTYNCTLNYCCTPAGAGGPGCLTNSPGFVNAAGGDFHLLSNSPCINAGKNALATGALDFEGNPRLKGGTVDMGAYEFQNPGSLISYAWLQQYGLPADGSADFLDADGDRMNNWQEWMAGTNPNDAASRLQLLSVSNSAGGATVTWLSVPNRAYSVLRSTNLQSGVFSTIATNIAGQPVTTSFSDTGAPLDASCFYRVAVQP